MKEKLLIVFVASVLGLIIATISFYIYQTTKNTPVNQEVQNPIVKEVKSDEEQLTNKGALTIDEPKAESIFDRRTIEVKGKTLAENTIIVSTNSHDEVVTPASDGKFSVSIDIEVGVNKLITRSIAPTGATTVDERIITFTTEEF